MDYSNSSVAEFRSVRDGARGNVPVRIVSASKAFPADQTMLWQAVSKAEHISMWLQPISGDLRVGGRYKIEGNASGTVLSCTVPEQFKATWEFAGSMSWVAVSLVSNRSSTRLKLEHAHQIDDEASDKHWREFGPGAVGVGWDLSLLGLELFVRNQFKAFNREDAEAWLGSDQGKELIRRCADAWRNAHVESGENPAVAKEMADRTAIAYAGD